MTRRAPRGRSAGWRRHCWPWPTPVAAQEDPAAAPTPAVELTWGIEVKAHFRDSEPSRFASPFPFTLDQLPRGQSRAFLETVDPGEPLRVLGRHSVRRGRAGKHPRGARQAGRHRPLRPQPHLDRSQGRPRRGLGAVRPRERARPSPEPRGVFARIGKFGKFERQDDRHLESYGLVATAFNRFEDLGVEARPGPRPPRLPQGSVTQGNPVFLRDPNALAGDNGTPERRLAAARRARARLSGVPILYDAEVEDLDFGEVRGAGAGLGLRFANDDGSRRPRRARLGLPARAGGDASSSRARSTAATSTCSTGRSAAALSRGSLPIRAPTSRSSAPMSGCTAAASRSSASTSTRRSPVWTAAASRPRRRGASSCRSSGRVAGRQLFPSVAPAARYSKLEPEFRRAAAHSRRPAVRWEWEKCDLGVRLAIVAGRRPHRRVRAATASSSPACAPTTRTTSSSPRCAGAR